MLLISFAFIIIIIIIDIILRAPLKHPLVFVCFEGWTKAMLRGGFERPNDAAEEMHFQQQDDLQAKQIRSQSLRWPEKQHEFK